MARKITYMQAISEALRQEMQRDPSIVIFGEDVMGGSGRDGHEDAWGGPFGLTKGFHAEFPGRILDTPISESAFIGAAVGAAATGLRPVAELMFVDFMGVCFDQIFNQGAKLRYMFGGKARVPMTIRTTYGAGIRAAAQHSECLYALFTHIPGLKVVIPSSPVRGERPARSRDSRRRSRDLLREQGHVRSRGRRARGAVHDSVRRGEHRA